MMAPSHTETYGSNFDTSNLIQQNLFLQARKEMSQGASHYQTNKPSLGADRTTVKIHSNQESESKNQTQRSKALASEESFGQDSTFRFKGRGSEFVNSMNNTQNRNQALGSNKAH